jgi:LysM repeat protein
VRSTSERTVRTLARGIPVPWCHGATVRKTCAWLAHEELARWRTLRNERSGGLLRAARCDAIAGTKNGKEQVSPEESAMVAVNAAAIARNHYASPSAPTASSAPSKADGKTPAGAAQPEPAKVAEYTIKKGDTLTSIAKMHGTDVDSLANANPQIRNRDLIHAGAVLKVPAAEVQATTSSAVCAAADAPAARQAASPEVQQAARRAAVGREEMLQRNLVRAATPESAAPVAKGGTKGAGVQQTPSPTAATTSSAATASSAATSSAATSSAPTTAPATGIRTQGKVGEAVAATAARLERAGLIDKNDRRELENGDVGPQDVAIGRRALDRLQASTPDAMRLLVEIPTMNNNITILQREALEQTLRQGR